MIEEKIKQCLDLLRTKDYKLILNEVGAGTPVYNQLVQVPGFSMRILGVESNNDMDFTRSINNIPSNYRLVSKDVSKILVDKTKERILSNYKTKENIFTLSNTVQIATDNNCVSHGWFTINSNNKYYTYHYTLPNISRSNQIKLIGYIGLDLLCSFMFEDYVSINGFIDDLYINNKQDIKELLKLNVGIHRFSNDYNHDNCIVFRHDSEDRRFNNIFRTENEIVLYKGSFNPISIAHIKIGDYMKKYGDLYYVISLNHRLDKKIDIDNLTKRIKLINDLGYDVIINTKPYFLDMYKNCENQFNYNKHIIHFPMGDDIYEIFRKDNINHYQAFFPSFVSKKQILNIDPYIKHYYYNGRFHVFNRNKENVINDLNYILEDFEMIDISSSEIRDGIKNDSFNELYKELNDERQKILFKSLKEW